MPRARTKVLPDAPPTEQQITKAVNPMDEPEKFKVTDKDTPAPCIVSPYDIPGIYDLIFGKENQ